MLRAEPLRLRFRPSQSDPAVTVDALEHTGQYRSGSGSRYGLGDAAFLVSLAIAL